VARRASLRASDADREQIVERLRHAAAEGRLAVHELEQRVASALGARTYGELDATVSDLPGTRAPARRPVPTRAVSVVRAHPALLLIAVPVILTAVAVTIAITVLWATLVVVALVLGHGRRRPPRGPWSYGPWGYGPPELRRRRYMRSTP
jgi:hypothetical protein